MKLTQGSKHQKPAEFPAWSPIWFLHRSGFQGPGAACCQIGCFARGDFTAQFGVSQMLDRLREETQEHPQMECP